MNQLPDFRGWAQLAKGQHYHFFLGGTRRTLCRLWSSDGRETYPANNQTGTYCEQDCPKCRERMAQMKAKGVKV